MRTEIIPGLQSSLALWRLDIDSELLFVGDAGETEPSRASRRTGIEWNNHYIAAPCYCWIWIWQHPARATLSTIQSVLISLALSTEWPPLA